MTRSATAPDRVADDALAELTAVRPSDDPVGAAVAAAALLAERAAQEICDRHRVPDHRARRRQPSIPRRRDGTQP